MTKGSKIKSLKSSGEFQYRDARRVVRSLRERTAPGLANLREDDTVDALIKAEDLLANALSVVRLCLGAIVVDDDGA